MLNFITNSNIDYIFKEPECYPFFEGDLSVGKWMALNSLTAPASKSEHMEDFLEMSGSIGESLSQEKYLNFIKSERPPKIKKTDNIIKEPKEEEMKTLIDNEEVTATLLLSYEASVSCGKGTKWCVGDRNTRKYYNSYSSRVHLIAMSAHKLAEPLDRIGLLLFDNRRYCLFDKVGCPIINGKIYDTDLNVLNENRLSEIDSVLSPKLIDSIYRHAGYRQ